MTNLKVFKRSSKLVTNHLYTYLVISTLEKYLGRPKYMWTLAFVYRIGSASYLLTDGKYSYQTKSTLDLIISNDPSSFETTYPSDKLSDHATLSATITCALRQTDQPTRTCFVLSTGDYASMRIEAEKITGENISMVTITIEILKETGIC